MTNPAPITHADVLDARRRLDGVIRRTPTRLADAVSRALGRPVYLKPEHLHKHFQSLQRR